MLVLTRKSGESIVINGNIVVTVVDLRSDRARLCIEVLKDIRVNRREVEDRLKNPTSCEVKKCPE